MNFDKVKHILHLFQSCEEEDLNSGNRHVFLWRHNFFLYLWGINLYGEG